MENNIKESDELSLKAKQDIIRSDVLNGRANFWKMSINLSKKEIQKKCEELEGIKIVYNVDEKDKESSTKKGFEQMKKGDYFYLCYGTEKIVLIGRITSDVIQSDLFEGIKGNWLFHEYEVVISSKRNIKYNGIDRGWSPRRPGTTYMIKQEEFEVFSKNILEPYFNISLYDEKGTETAETETNSQEERIMQFTINPFSSMLIESKNLIFRGAPGTGKSYLAKEIAADIISNGSVKKYADLTDEQKMQVEFVQFHPSYDYSDFVEGLRPKVNDDGTMGFELQDGIFKKFVARARKNYEDSRKSKETIEKEISVQESMTEFFSNIELGVDTFKTINGNEFIITSIDDKYIYISIPGNASVNRLTLNLDEIRRMLESGEKFEKIKDIMAFFGRTFATQAYSYDFVIYKEILKQQKKMSKLTAKTAELKKYIFIIDEINRGEISKIFGELFFAIDPGYRGRAGEISTQYANMHSDPNEKFYIPENVYIIGTMNDIDRSVDSFDFAMRRRFRFVELKADEHLEMLSELNNEELKSEAISRMTALNNEIANVEDLNENYQIGAAYFLKLKTLDFDRLWTDYLKPLLQEYIQGMYDEKDLMKRFEKAYGYKAKSEGDVNETAQDQG